jgi:hypothetical protein
MELNPLFQLEVPAKTIFGAFPFFGQLINWLEGARLVGDEVLEDVVRHYIFNMPGLERRVEVPADVFFEMRSQAICGWLFYGFPPARSK